MLRLNRGVFKKNFYGNLSRLFLIYFLLVVVYLADGTGATDFEERLVSKTTH